MLLKVVAPAIVFAAPVSDTLYAAVPAATVMPVVAVVFPWNATVCPSTVSKIATVAARTVLANVAPPLRVTVTEFSGCVAPTAPETVTIPVVLKATLALFASVVLSIEPVLIGVPTPVPTVSVFAFAIVALPSMISPVEVPPTSAVSVTFTGVVPRLITPTPAVEIVPAIFFKDGAVATTPPVNAITSVL